MGAEQFSAIAWGRSFPPVMPNFSGQIPLGGQCPQTVAGFALAGGNSSLWG